MSLLVRLATTEPTYSNAYILCCRRELARKGLVTQMSNHKQTLTLKSDRDLEVEFTSYTDGLTVALHDRKASNWLKGIAIMAKSDEVALLNFLAQRNGLTLVKAA